MSLRTPTVERPATREEGIDAAVEAARERAVSLNAATSARLADSIGDARHVLLGEATHGTSEFYRWRARLTARLIAEHDFDFVAVEGDWTDCYAVNRYVQRTTVGGGDAADARAILDAFDRWPAWMWANWETVEFVDWLREQNAGRPRDERVGFYGMDVYSLFESMQAVVDYLEDVDTEAASRARDAYACFEPYDENARAYARSTRLVPEDCEDEAIEVLADLRQDSLAVDRRGDESRDPDDRFATEQNALVVRNAEAYYRAMVRGDAESWNVRDEHMVETVERLSDHHEGGRGVVWAHNTHVGDARATDMARRGEVNVGQLMRETHGEDVAIVGFGTHRGSVIAGASWDAPMERMTVPEARRGSYEDVLHWVGTDDLVLTFGDGDHGGALGDPRGHRAIGVVYHPERDLGNYVPTVLPDRYDAFLYLDETSALNPLHIEPGGGRPPETYPWGL